MPYGIETVVGDHCVWKRPAPVDELSDGDFMPWELDAVWMVCALMGDAGSQLIAGGDARVPCMRSEGEGREDVGDEAQKSSVGNHMTGPVPWDPVDLLSDNNGDPLSNVEEVETEPNDSEPRIGVFASEEVEEVLYVDVLPVISPPDW